MSLKKKAMQGSAIAVLLVMVSVAAEAASVYDTTENSIVSCQTVTADETEEAVICLPQFQEGALRGSSAVSSAKDSADTVAAEAVPEKEIFLEESIQEKFVENTEIIIAENSIEENIAMEETAITEGTISEEEILWQNRLLPDVNDYLNVRVAADENAVVVGKLYKGDMAEIVETGDSWTHIISGNVDGYVKNEYCLFGQEAFAYAAENLDTEAEILTDGLRVRSEASEDSTIVTIVSQGTSLKVDSDAEEVEGWVAVLYDNNTRYVSADYVSMYYDLGVGITIEEEQAEWKRLAEEEAAKAVKNNTQTTKVETIQNDAVAASADEVTLLAALIQCEAGNECYEGQVAVGAVVMNRVRSGSYPSTIYDVIYQPNQFTPAGRGSVANVIASGPKDSCIQAAQEALNGTDNTGGATRFKRASTGQAGLVIGNHVFY